MQHHEEPNDDSDLPKPTKSLAVLETEKHAEEVLACAEGQNYVEHNYETYGRAVPPFAVDQYSPLPGRDWESLRPIEVALASAPVVPFAASWRDKRGRFCSLSGVGKYTLHLLRARRQY